MHDAILVPTDGSLTAQQAVEHAIDRARRDGAELHALNIVDTGSTVARSFTRAWDRDEIAEKLTQEASEDLDKAMEPAVDAGIDVHKAVRPHESVADGILAYAEEHDIDLVVMGTHGRAGLERMLLGSVAERVVRKSRRPVLLIPPEPIPE